MHKIRRMPRLCKALAKQPEYIILDSCKPLGNKRADRCTQVAIFFTHSIYLINNYLNK